jgi:hypothetical protein
VIQNLADQATEKGYHADEANGLKSPTEARAARIVKSGAILRILVISSSLAAILLLAAYFFAV